MNREDYMEKIRSPEDALYALREEFTDSKHGPCFERVAATLSWFGDDTVLPEDLTLGEDKEDKLSRDVAYSLGYERGYRDAMKEKAHE